MEFLFHSLQTLLVSAKGVSGLIAILIGLPVWIAACFFIPYSLGVGINRLFFGGQVFARLRSLFSWTVALGFAAPVVLILGFALTQIFSEPISRWWYDRVFAVGVGGNVVGIVSSALKGIVTGKE